MNMLTTKLRNRAIALTVMAACVTALPAYAQGPDSTPKRQAASKQENIGVATGFTVGAVAAGPVGAIVGAAAGAWLGDRYHKQATARASLAADLDKSESDRTRLTQSVTELNGSLAREQEHAEQLDLAMSYTKDLQTDVTFRTNDASVRDPSGLLKLGALAAALPDAKVRVAGYADPRGSDAVNDALSKRRADAVAAILANAGVAPDRLIIEAHGKSASTSTEGDLDGYAFDRHVTVQIERPDGQSMARND